jgi:hypothetical protein
MEEARRLRRKKHKEYILEKKQVPCQDCGGIFPEYCMDFHHLDEKSKSQSLKNEQKSFTNIACRWGKNKIDEELEKCVVLCANCHRIRHHNYK